MSSKDLSDLFGGYQANGAGQPAPKSLDELFGGTNEIKDRWGISSAVDTSGKPVKELSIRSAEGQDILAGTFQSAGNAASQQPKRKGGPIFSDIPDAVRMSDVDINNLQPGQEVAVWPRKPGATPVFAKWSPRLGRFVRGDMADPDSVERLAVTDSEAISEIESDIARLEAAGRSADAQSVRSGLESFKNTGDRTVFNSPKFKPSTIEPGHVDRLLVEEDDNTFFMKPDDVAVMAPLGSATLAGTKRGGAAAVTSIAANWGAQAASKLIGARSGILGKMAQFGLTVGGGMVGGALGEVASNLVLPEDKLDDVNAQRLGGWNDIISAGANMTTAKPGLTGVNLTKRFMGAGEEIGEEIGQAAIEQAGAQLFGNGADMSKVFDAPRIAQAGMFGGMLTDATRLGNFIGGNGFNPSPQMNWNGTEVYDPNKPIEGRDFQRVTGRTTDFSQPTDLSALFAPQPTLTQPQTVQPTQQAASDFTLVPNMQAAAPSLLPAPIEGPGPAAIPNPSYHEAGNFGGEAMPNNPGMGSIQAPRARVGGFETPYQAQQQATITTESTLPDEQTTQNLPVTQQLGVHANLMGEIGGKRGVIPMAIEISQGLGLALSSIDSEATGFWRSRETGQLERNPATQFNVDIPHGSVENGRLKPELRARLSALAASTAIPLGQKGASWIAIVDGQQDVNGWNAGVELNITGTSQAGYPTTKTGNGTIKLDVHQVSAISEKLSEILKSRFNISGNIDIGVINFKNQTKGGLRFIDFESDDYVSRKAYPTNDGGKVTIPANALAQAVAEAYDATVGSQLGMMASVSMFNFDSDYFEEADFGATQGRLMDPKDRLTQDPNEGNKTTYGKNYRERLAPLNAQQLGRVDAATEEANATRRALAGNADAGYQGLTYDSRGIPFNADLTPANASNLRTDSEGRIAEPARPVLRREANVPPVAELGDPNSPGITGRAETNNDLLPPPPRTTLEQDNETKTPMESDRTGVMEPSLADRSAERDTRMAQRAAQRRSLSKNGVMRDASESEDTIIEAQRRRSPDSSRVLTNKEAKAEGMDISSGADAVLTGVGDVNKTKSPNANFLINQAQETLRASGRPDSLSIQVTPTKYTSVIGSPDSTESNELSVQVINNSGDVIAQATADVKPRSRSDKSIAATIKGHRIDVMPKYRGLGLAIAMKAEQFRRISEALQNSGYSGLMRLNMEDVSANNRSSRANIEAAMPGIEGKVRMDVNDGSDQEVLYPKDALEMISEANALEKKIKEATDAFNKASRELTPDGEVPTQEHLDKLWELEQQLERDVSAMEEEVLKRRISNTSFSMRIGANYSAESLGQLTQDQLLAKIDQFQKNKDRLESVRGSNRFDMMGGDKAIEQFQNAIDTHTKELADRNNVDLEQHARDVEAASKGFTKTDSQMAGRPQTRSEAQVQNSGRTAETVQADIDRENARFEERVKAITGMTHEEWLNTDVPDTNAGQKMESQVERIMRTHLAKIERLDAELANINKNQGFTKTDSQMAGRTQGRMWDKVTNTTRSASEIQADIDKENANYERKVKELTGMSADEWSNADIPDTQANAKLEAKVEKLTADSASREEMLRAELDSANRKGFTKTDSKLLGTDDAGNSPLSQSEKDETRKFYEDSTKLLAPEDQSVVKLVSQGSTAKQVLEEVGKRNDIYGQMAKLLLKSSLADRLRTPVVGEYNPGVAAGSGWNGLYESGSVMSGSASVVAPSSGGKYSNTPVGATRGLIRINMFHMFNGSETVRTIVHEIVHSVTVDALNKAILGRSDLVSRKSDTQKLKGAEYLARLKAYIKTDGADKAVVTLAQAYLRYYDTIPANVRKAYESGNGGMTNPGGHRTVMNKGGQYGVVNINEFVAEAMTNPSFQTVLKTLKAGKTNMFTKFVDSVRQILGLSPGDTNMLTEVIESTAVLSGTQLEDIARPTSSELPGFKDAYVSELANLLVRKNGMSLSEATDTITKGIDQGTIEMVVLEEQGAPPMSAPELESEVRKLEADRKRAEAYLMEVSAGSGADAGEVAFAQARLALVNSDIFNRKLALAAIDKTASDNIDLLANRQELLDMAKRRGVPNPDNDFLMAMAIVRGQQSVGFVPTQQQMQSVMDENVPKLQANEDAAIQNEFEQEQLSASGEDTGIEDGNAGNVGRIKGEVTPDETNQEADMEDAASSLADEVQFDSEGPDGFDIGDVTDNPDNTDEYGKEDSLLPDIPGGFTKPENKSLSEDIKSGKFWRREVADTQRRLQVARDILERGKMTPGEAVKLGAQTIMDIATISGLSANQAQLVRIADRSGSSAVREISRLLNGAVPGRREDAVGQSYHSAVSTRNISFRNKLNEAIRPFESELREMDRDQQRQFFEDLGRAVSEGTVDSKGKWVPATPRDQKMAKAVQAIRGLYKELHSYQRRAGIELSNWGGTYLPRMLNNEAVVNDAKGFIAAATEAYKTTGMDAYEAEKAAMHWFDAVQKGDSGFSYDSNFIFDGATLNGEPNHTRDRVFGPEADKIMDKFYNRNVLDATNSYINRAVRNAEISSRFGSDFGKYRALQERIIREGNNKLLDSVNALVSAQLGASSAKNRLDSSLTNFANTYSAIHFLPRATFSSLSEPAILACRTGNVLDVFAVYKDSAKQFMRNLVGASPDYHAKLAEDLGLVLGALADSATSTSLDTRYFSEGSRQMGTWLTNQFFRRTGLAQWTDGTRVAAVKMGETFLNRLAEDIQEGGNTQQSSTRFLRELGIKDVAAFSKFVTDMNRAGLKGDARRQQIMAQRGKQADMYRKALIRFTEQTIMNPNQGTRPRWASHPIGAIVFNLQSYLYAFHENVTKRTMRLAKDSLDPRSGMNVQDRLRMAAPIGIMIGSSVIQFLLGELRKKLFNDPARRYELPESVSSKIGRAVSRANLMGRYDFLVNAFSSIKYDKEPATVMSGPIIGLLSEGFKSASDLSSSSNSPNTNTAERKAGRMAYDMIGQPALNATSSMIPGGWIGGALGAAGIQAASHPGVRESFVEKVAGPPVAPKKRQPKTSVWDEIVPDAVEEGLK